MGSSGGSSAAGGSIAAPSPSSPSSSSLSSSPDPAEASADVSSTAPAPTITATAGPAAATAPATAAVSASAEQAAAVRTALQDRAANGPAPRPTLTLQGPERVAAGEEFAVTVDLQTEQGLNRIRAQVRFDGSALQLLDASPGGLVPDSLGSKVSRVPGGAQLDVTAATDAPFTGSGTVMQLRFKALKARPSTAIAAQLAVVGTEGLAVAATTPTPLSLVVTE
jgi:hypothetical protein